MSSRPSRQLQLLQASEHWRLAAKAYGCAAVSAQTLKERTDLYNKQTHALTKQGETLAQLAQIDSALDETWQGGGV